MYKINFNHLYYFLTISKEGSIVKASKKLHMTQPALSHQLRLLEEDLGKKLFDRVGRRLVINKNGLAVKEYADKIFRHSEEMIHFLKSDKKNILKIIKIGTVPWLPKQETHRFITPLLTSPHIRVEVYQKDLETLIKDIAENRLDIVLCDSPYSGRSKKLQGHRLATESIICVKDSKEGLRGHFPKNLNGQKVITYSEASMMADKIDDFLMKNKVSVETVGSFTDSSLIRIAVEKGSAIGFLPESVAVESIKQKRMVKVGELDKLKFSFWAITRKNYKKDGLIASTISKASS